MSPFIRTLPASSQAIIFARLSDALPTELIDTAMDSRLADLADTIDISDI